VKVPRAVSDRPGRELLASPVGYRWAEERDEPGIFAVLETANFHHVPSAEMPALDLTSFFVAEHEGAIVGAAGFTTSGQRGKTTLMAVDPAYRGHGIGERLQELRMDAMSHRGAAVVITNADRPETIDWYRRKFGYRVVGSVRKLHEFGARDIDHWTTLEADLEQWRLGQDRRKAQPSPR